MTLPQTFELNSGHHIPSVGLGTWMGKLGGHGDRENRDIVVNALLAGYRHVDTAASYQVEDDVGEAIKESKVPREELFITTKLACTDHGRVPQAIDTSLRKLGTDYVDLWLMHWPCAQNDGGVRVETPTPLDTWLAMEDVLKTGKARAIGVSNFSIKTLAPLLEKGNIVPAVNQIEVHPNLPQNELRAFHHAHGIHTIAFASLGGQIASGQGARGSLHTNPKVEKIAGAHKAASGQVLLSWAVGHGVSVIPKSANEGRVKQNMQLLELSADEVEVLDDLHREPGQHIRIAARIVDGRAYGWTPEELGWDP